MTKCPLTRGVRLREVSVSGGSTVASSFTIMGSSSKPSTLAISSLQMLNDVGDNGLSFQIFFCAPILVVDNIFVVDN